MRLPCKGLELIISSVHLDVLRLQLFMWPGDFTTFAEIFHIPGGTSL